MFYLGFGSVSGVLNLGLPTPSALLAQEGKEIPGFGREGPFFVQDNEVMQMYGNISNFDNFSTSHSK